MPHRSPFPDVEIPDLPLHELVLAGAADRGDALALVDGAGPDGLRVTYAQLDTAVRRLAAGLAEWGLRKGDVLALFSPNTVAFPIVLYAASMCGATVTTVNSLYTVDEITAQLRDCGARVLVTVSPFLDRAAPAADAAGVDEVLVCDRAEGRRSILELMASTAPEPRVPIDPASDVVVLPYSSGTTGRAKGVMLTHRNIVANLVQTHSAVRLGPGETTVAVLPFFHMYGLTTLLNHPLHLGATVVVLPRFDLERFLAVIQEHRVTRASVAPPIVLALAKNPLVDRYDLSSLRTVLSAAAPLDQELAEAAARRVGCPVVQGYGMTELSPCSHVVPDHDEATPPGTVGKLVANTECRVVDPATGEDTDGVGELWIRGPQVMRGYLGRPEETDALVDRDGWLHTGDVGRVDDRGNFFVVDRLKELIKYKGYQVPPAELEAVLLSHPGIADAAVIGTAVDGEEVPKAFVVRSRDAADLDAGAVLAFVAERVAPHKKVRAVEFVDSIPKSAAGKILRRELRERERARTAG
ncbi:Acyl-CoA synthetase (AMP-forming)/AMP-acid ligase II [Streptoalloteichus tenebrarius]|uniref:Acyl-CoA synthetase (AMP-forming)/AMP-acid ligase II n=1 Tax=Streptoalloteichus tenebrarius (strain ATCC 17920 / DSM 40477 / JCM 4838 / CBS 697.72 / NBRC 16177 / NCIMB 11028 / NRRL B-12390 / A12253. 1 / ISP 5477) TaxID=1933 RepID=A0ABT1HXU5_STRSD|nr:AMP-binding protein [Streptoalloteichus tenebrarius]MCP2260326.1 Acyl-CoA synthetase (AMP-forming)/AMP-acid ligase II [Streptoalloteichus tenebrarius]BFF03076.1 4-coumarate--CoA ligase family protein [Streptoalloteichus tenebrarius]